MPSRWREVPPTAGLPMTWRDFVPGARRLSLEQVLAAFLEVPSVQLECSGTAALVIALTTLKRSSDRRKGDADQCESCQRAGLAEARPPGFCGCFKGVRHLPLQSLAAHTMDRTTPPSTRSADPLVAEARGLHT